MFGSGSTSSVSKTEGESKGESKSDDKSDDKSPSPEASTSSSIRSPATNTADTSPDLAATSPPKTSTDQAASGEKRSGNGSPPGRQEATDKKRRSSGVGSKASSLLASAKNSLSFGQGGRTSTENMVSQTPLQKLGKQDPALAVPQGQHNNSAGESVPSQRSTFKVGVWEDRNKKCRRTMEDTHAFLYNFLPTPAPTADGVGKGTTDSDSQDMIETDNGYFAIFDGHAGTFAADWCGKKLHLILEDIIKKNPNVPIPELLDMTFTSADSQLEKLPNKNSGCTAAIAVLRWEDRVPSDRSVTGSQAIAPAAAAAAKTKASGDDSKQDEEANADTQSPETAHAKLKGTASRQRVLYTANVGDARIILCRNGKALRLSYDHKGSDENEGKRIANAGGLILNNRVNGVLAVTRALGDSYMKDLVTGHPYTTETVIQPDSDEFIIIACDGLWDVCSDQEAVERVRNIEDPFEASKTLVEYALSRFSTDNLSCLVVRLDRDAVMEAQNNKSNPIGVEGDQTSAQGGVTEADKILRDTKQKIDDGSTPAVGVSASNSGRGRDPPPRDDGAFKPTMLDGKVEEEPASYDEDDDDDDDVDDNEDKKKAKAAV